MIRGEVWWADLGLPFGSEPGFLRPVLVVQADSFNRSRIATVVAVPLTTNLELLEAPGNVGLDAKEGGLPKDSVVVTSQISTLDRRRFTKKVGSIDARKLIEVEKGIRIVLGLA